MSTRKYCLALSSVALLIGDGSLIGNGGDTPNGSGGMIPSTAPPFAMTRWVAQTRQNYVSMTPYNETDTTIHGFQGTHQPAIWMGESGQATIVPGAGDVKDLFEERGMNFSRENQVLTASYYSVNMDVKEGGTIFAEQSASVYIDNFPLFTPDEILPRIPRRSFTFHIYRYQYPLHPRSSHSPLYHWVCRREQPYLP